MHVRRAPTCLHRSFAAALALTLLVATPQPAEAFVTEFGRQVNAAIDQGLVWMVKIGSPRACSLSVWSAK